MKSDTQALNIYYVYFLVEPHFLHFLVKVKVVFGEQFYPGSHGNLLAGL